MWPFTKKTQNPTIVRPDPIMVRIEALEKAFPIGCELDYLGRVVRITGHWKWSMSVYDVHSFPQLQGDYADNAGVIRSIAFSYEEARTLQGVDPAYRLP